MSHVMRLLVALALALLMVGAVACGGTEETDPAANEEEKDEESAAKVTIEAAEYKFNLPPTLKAGSTTFTLENVGKEPHFIQIQELKGNAPPIPRLLKLPQKKAEAFFVRQVAQTGVIKPGETSEPFVAELTPGRYGYVCFVSTKGKPPHAFLGMAGEFTVK